MDALDYQRQLLDHARQINHDTPISDETARAYLATPRHRFVRRYREWTSPHWQEVTESNLGEHLPTLYADNAIILFGDDDNNIQSTISQPSFVLRMLDLLQLQPGHTVLELGAGSGWNAALIGKLVGPTGRVFSLEIIPDMAERASAAIAEFGITNVQVIAADGSNVYVGWHDLNYRVKTGHIAAWDGSHWSALGSGVNNKVAAIAVSGRYVYVGGEFTVAGGEPAGNFTRYLMPRI